MIFKKFEIWVLFATNWGLFFDTISSALAWTVSFVEFRIGPDSSPRTLAKVYWATFNAAISSAFFITTFRYMLLRIELNDISKVAGDVMAHVINSVLMFCLLITSRHPMRLLHFYIPAIFCIVYMLFTLIYYKAGGLSPFDTVWIYPVLDWSQPRRTSLWAVISTCSIIVIHFVVVGITLGRDALTKQYTNPPVQVP
ncbi:hypothetical protein PYW07_007373 [Mythimna separata]|uniref:Uncharacterized protein n=1 Tax=Mythimna separata TaxID=271217 RepID=A0AAD7Z0Z0_MYTSE|nr:hypothetical protein PYW07_007373 [Mythimna separata]